MKYSHPPNYLKKIKDSRTRFGLTQQRMAELRGVSFAFVYRWVNGQTRPSSLTWQRITQAEVLGVEALSKDDVVDEKPTHIVRDDQVPYEVAKERERILDFSSLPRESP